MVTTITSKFFARPSIGRILSGVFHDAEDEFMARLPPITSKDQVAAKDHAAFDSIVASRGAVQGPFTMFLHRRNSPAALPISVPMSASRVRSICGYGCWPR